MSRIALFVVSVLITAPALAGTITGKVSPGNSVVYVDAIPGKTFPAPERNPVIDQRGLKFVPALLVVQQGTTVEFQNDDSVQHNVFWPSVGGNRRDAHNLGSWSQGEKRSFTFDKPGVVPLLCNIHPSMAGYIVVAPTPYFAQTDANGNYKIENIPNGKYDIVAWHEDMQTQTKTVEVSGTASADFTLAK